MYMPIPKGKPKANPMQVRESQKYMFAAINVVLGTIGFTLYGLYTYIQGRKRITSEDADARLLEDGSGNRNPNANGNRLAMLHTEIPKRVIIVGGSAAGATTAAAITKADPSVEVVVFDENRKVPLTALMPYAQVGHRSYDLTTTGAPDTLSSPTTWTVTRDARLVTKGIKGVSPDRNVVIDSDGVEHKYDALVLAVGSLHDVDGCKIKGLTEENVDRHRICVSPHVTRDTLQTVWDGNVVCVKISTRDHNVVRGAADKKAESATSAAFVKAMLAENKKMQSLNDLSSSPIVGTSGMNLLTSSSSSSSSSSNAIDVWGPAKKGSAALLAGRAMSPSTHYSRSIISSTRLAYDRSCDVSFISSANIIWKFLEYFRRSKRMPLSVYCDEAGPCEGLGHKDYTDAVLDFWARRQIPFFGNQRLVEVDVLNGEATFEAVVNPKTAAGGVNTVTIHEAIRTKVPFKVLFLDFPRKAPSFIAASGLSCKEADGYVAVDPNTLQHVTHKNVFALGDCAALPTLKSYAGVFTQVPVVSNNVLQYINGVKKLPADVAAELADGGYKSFDSTTSGDAKKSKQQQKPRTADAAAAAKAAIYSRIPNPTALYDGYSAAPITMTTWRLMWPERRYLPDEVATTVSNGYSYPASMGVGEEVAAAAAYKQKLLADMTTSSNDNTATTADANTTTATPLSSNIRTNCHKWNNTAWEDPRGLLNGIYLQLFGYELMYWFIFMRGHWHPPTWFTAPRFPEVVGADDDNVPSFDKAAVAAANATTGGGKQ